jgi:hypothetical protein
MIRFVFLLMIALALACSGETTGVDDAMEGAAADVAAPAAEGGAEEVAEAASPEMDEAMVDDAVAQKCLGLVADGKFPEAVPVCTEALGLEPANNELQQALDRAKSETARAAVEGAAAADDPAAAAGELLR